MATLARFPSFGFFFLFFFDPLVSFTLVHNGTWEQL